jgi:large subunit ribosomal protein L9
MQYQLLLIDDVDDLGRSGEVVKVKPGFARNFLLPKRKAMIADKNTLRLQARLQEERAKRAQVDKKDAEGLSQRINGMQLALTVKVDPDGQMYGSVSAIDIVHAFENEGISLEKRNVVLPQPIKELGVFPITLKLKEGVPASFTLTVQSDRPLPQKPAEETKA